MAWVIIDFTATPNTSEISVNKGQQVEIVELCNSKPDFCMIRISDQIQGLVPLSALKQSTISQKSSMSKTFDNLHTTGKFVYSRNSFKS